MKEKSCLLMIHYHIINNGTVRKLIVDYPSICESNLRTIRIFAISIFCMAGNGREISRLFCYSTNI